MRSHFWPGCHPGHAVHHGFFRERGGYGRGDEHMGHHHGPDDDGGFGVRRPLRFLAHRLNLSEAQLGTLARVLDELKIERAQAAVDGRRTLAEFADAVSGEAFDEAKGTAGGDRRVQSADRLRAAVLKALRDIHAVLNADQRAQLSYLIRTGALVV